MRYRKRDNYTMTYSIAIHVSFSFLDPHKSKAFYIILLYNTAC